MTPQELKTSILQFAIHGTLVGQSPADGTADELLQNIQADKNALVKAGIIKKEKTLPPISEEEIPFEIPNTWKWVRIGDIFHLTMGQSPTGTSVSEFGNGMEFHQGKIFFGEDYLEESKQKTNEVTKIAEEKSVLLCVRAPVGIANITLRKICIGRGLCALKPLGGMEEVFSLYLVRAFQTDFIKKSTGTTFKAITNDVVKMQCVPLPPLEEQRRIVAKLEEILPLIDQYEVAWNKLEEFNKRFPGDMQKSILQLAIQGKLVEQRSEEGTGEELFQQIQVEKQVLIKAGKIKKEKPLPEIADEEIPFDIPDAWKWVRFADLMNSMSTGPFGSMLHKSDYIDDGIPLVNPANIVNGKIIASDKMMVSVETAKRLESYVLKTGMIIMGRRGEMGRCAVVGEKESGWLCGTGSFFMMPSACMYVHFLNMFFSTPYAKAYLSGASVGTTMSNLNHKILSNMPVPLPPVAEQQRIVAKLDEILPLCDRLK